jgi:hypothetical protein
MSLDTSPQSLSISKDTDVNDPKRAIAYSMDLLIPGLYIWLGRYTFRLYGAEPEDTPYKYPGMLDSHYGVALVLPGYRIFTTYKGSYDPR